MKTEKPLVIFLGPPGCGKGSLSNLCVKRLGWQQLSTGNLCRQHIASNTQIGKNIDFNIKSGKLISDDLIISMVSQWLIDNNKDRSGVILDGFPRTLSQAQALCELFLKSEFVDIKLHVVKIIVSDKCVIDRIIQRAICKNYMCQAVYSLQEHSNLNPIKSMVCNDCGSFLIKRPDDEMQSIVERLNLYKKHEKELINFYHTKKINIDEIMGEKSLEEVYVQLLNVLDIKNS